MQTQELCKSVFKDGATKTTREKFTHKLTELINQLEKGKQTIGQK